MYGPEPLSLSLARVLSQNMIFQTETLAGDGRRYFTIPADAPQGLLNEAIPVASAAAGDLFASLRVPRFVADSR